LSGFKHPGGEWSKPPVLSSPSLFVRLQVTRADVGGDGGRQGLPFLFSPPFLSCPCWGIWIHLLVTRLWVPKEMEGGSVVGKASGKRLKNPCALLPTSVQSSPPHLRLWGKERGEILFLSPPFAGEGGYPGFSPSQLFGSPASSFKGPAHGTLLLEDFLRYIMIASS